MVFDPATQRSPRTMKKQDLTPQWVPLRVSQKSKVLIGQDFMIFELVTYFRRAALRVFLSCDWNGNINLAPYADGLSVKACGVVEDTGAEDTSAPWDLRNADVTTVKQEVVNG